MAKPHENRQGCTGLALRMVADVQAACDVPSCSLFSDDEMVIPKATKTKKMCRGLIAQACITCASGSVLCAGTYLLLDLLAT